MSLRPDRKYDGTVGPGACMIISQSGTLGFQLTLECEDGEIQHVIWLTKNTKERSFETFAMLGVAEAKLQNASYVENQLAMDIADREVSFTTVEEEYPKGSGKKHVKVRFINKRGALAGGVSPAKAAAAFFGGKVSGGATKPMTDFPPAAERKTVITDDDVPF